MDLLSSDTKTILDQFFGKKLLLKVVRKPL